MPLLDSSHECSYSKGFSIPRISLQMVNGIYWLVALMMMTMMMFVGGTCSVLFLNVYALFLFSGNKLRLFSFALDREKRDTVRSVFKRIIWTVKRTSVRRHSGQLSMSAVFATAVYIHTNNTVLSMVYLYIITYLCLYYELSKISTFLCSVEQRLIDM